MILINGIDIKIYNKFTKEIHYFSLIKYVKATFTERQIELHNRQ